MKNLLILLSFGLIPLKDSSEAIYADKQTFLDIPGLLPWYRFFRKVGFEISEFTGSHRKYLEKAKNAEKLQPQIPSTVPFPCNVTEFRSKKRPKSVHQLRPGDIDVIGAMGDSLTAANGAFGTMILNVGTENRGVSWSGGGQATWRQFLTLPNILKEFNPNLVGYATGDGLSITKSAQFNVGEPISMSQDMPYMAKELVRRIRNDPRVQFKTDWKLITLMIGANNLCSDICFWNNPRAYPEVRRKDLVKTLRYLRDNMPRTIVNILLTPDVRILTRLTNEGACVFTRIFECSCLFGTRFQRDRPLYFKIIERVREIDEEISRMVEFLESETFTVLLQPFTRKLKFPKRGDKTDGSFLSADCFHFSQKGHAWGVKTVFRSHLPNWWREQKILEVAKLEFTKSTSKSIELPIYKTPGKLTR